MKMAKNEVVRKKVMIMKIS